MTALKSHSACLHHCCPSFSYDPSLLNPLKMMSWKRKQSGSSDMGSPLLLSPCRYCFGVTHRVKMHTSKTKNVVELSLLMCGISLWNKSFNFPNLSLLKPSDLLLFSVPQQESTDYLDRGTTTNFSRKGPSTIAKIKEALNFMRNQQFEVQRAHISPISPSLPLP